MALALNSSHALASAVTALIAACPPLDRNSRYFNLIQCTHFADNCIIAERGGRMYDTLEQIAIEQRWAAEMGIVLDTDPRQVSAAGTRPSSDCTT